MLYPADLAIGGNTARNALPSGVVRERGGDYPAGLELGVDPVPHRDEALDQALGAEEVHDCVLGRESRLLRVAAQVGVPGLPWNVRADKRGPEDFGLAGDGVH